MCVVSSCETCVTGITVYDKMFEGKIFRRFCGFLLTMNVLPLKILLLCNWNTEIGSQGKL